MPDLAFVVKDPDKAYLGTQLWLPKKRINAHAVKASLEFTVAGETGQEFLQLWEDGGQHLAVPREYIRQDDYRTLSFPVVDLTPTSFPRTSYRSHVVLDFLEPKSYTQRHAFKAFSAVDHGLLNLACGKGKTTIALHHIAKRGMNALIIVNQTTILDQWKKSIQKFLSFEGEIGLIQGNPEEWDWRHPITIAMLHTLARYPDHVTPDIRRHFGIVIWDEVHHLSAPYFCVTATMFPGQRYGLSATVSREDGTEVVYNYHIGDPFYKDLMQTVKPNIRFRQTPFLIPEADYQEIITDMRGNPNVSKLRVYVGTMPDRNEYVALDLLDAVRAGRKVLALSHSKEQLKLLHAMFLNLGVDCGICTGDQKVAERWKALREKQIIFGTHQLVMEAIDEDSLDTLFWLTPFGSSHPDGGKNALQQGMGRIQGYRFREGMKHPLVVIFDDVYIKQFHKMCNKLRLQMRRWPTDEGGPYDFTSLKPRPA